MQWLDAESFTVAMYLPVAAVAVGSQFCGARSMSADVLPILFSHPWAVVLAYDGFSRPLRLPDTSAQLKLSEQLFHSDHPRHRHHHQQQQHPHQHRHQHHHHHQLSMINHQ